MVTRLRHLSVRALILVTIIFLQGCIIPGSYLRSSTIHVRASAETLEQAFESVKRIGDSLGLLRELDYGIDGNATAADYCGASVSPDCAKRFNQLAKWQFREMRKSDSIDFGFDLNTAGSDPHGQVRALHIVNTEATVRHGDGGTEIRIIVFNFDEGTERAADALFGKWKDTLTAIYGQENVRVGRL